MIDITELKGAVAWLQRGKDSFDRDPQNASVREGLTHSVEVTYNVAERVLCQSLSFVSNEPTFAFVSSRELMRLASEEGLRLSTGETWHRYGLAMEHVKDTLGDSFSEDVLPLLPQYISELRDFATRLEKRLV